MKKKIFYGIFALLSVSLFFLACDTGTSSESTVSPTWPPADDSSSGGGNKVAQAQAVADLLGGIASGTTVTLSSTGSLAADKAVTIPTGVTLKVEGAYAVEGDLVVNGDLVVETGVTFTVESGGALTAAGNVSVPSGATLSVEGTINNTGDLKVEGTYTITSGAAGTNTGTVTVEYGGTILSGGYIAGNGTNTVETGGTVYFADTDSGTAFIGDSDAVFDISNGTFSYGNGFYSVDSGSVTLTTKNADTLWLISEGTVLKIKAGATLVIANDSSSELRVKSFADNPAIQGAAGAQINVTAGGAKFSYKSGSDSNFYTNSGTLIAVETELAGKTYEWDENAGGAGVAGWKADS